MEKGESIGRELAPPRESAYTCAGEAITTTLMSLDNKELPYSPTGPVTPEKVREIQPILEEHDIVLAIPQSFGKIVRLKTNE